MNREFPDRPLVGIGVAVFRAHRVLLIKRGHAPKAGEWSLPGGLQRIGETLAESARREVREEAGLEIRIHGLADVVDYIERSAPSASVRYHYTLIDLVASAEPGEAIAGGDATDVSWVDMTDLGRFRLWSETERVIRLAYDRWFVVDEKSKGDSKTQQPLRQ